MTVANYRPTVPDAFGEVEDRSAAIRRLDEQRVGPACAVESSGRAVGMANYRYRIGIATRLDATAAQNLELQARLADLKLPTQTLNVSIRLVNATAGGGNSASPAQARPAIWSARARSCSDANSRSRPSLGIA